MSSQSYDFSSSHVWMWELDYNESWVPKNWCFLNCGVEEVSWESLGPQGDQISAFWRKSILNIHWKDWYWSWNSSTLATWCEELTHWKRYWCWERLKAGGEGDNRGWDGWMVSLTQWTWVWLSSGSRWWTEKPGMLQSMGSQKVGHDSATELNWLFFSSRRINQVPLLHLGLASHFLLPICSNIFMDDDSQDFECNPYLKI